LQFRFDTKPWTRGLATHVWRRRVRAKPATLSAAGEEASAPQITVGQDGEAVDANPLSGAC